MRILMTTDTVGGVWTFTSELTQQLLERGHAVHLVSFGRAPSPEQQSWAEASTCADNSGAPDPVAGTWDCRSAKTSSGQQSFTYTATEIPLEWMQDNEQAFEAGQSALLATLKHHPADLILSNQFCFGRLDTPTPRIVVAHSDVLSWARACKPSALEPTPWLNRYTSMVQAGLLDAAAVITPTAWMGKALTTNFFLPRNYFVVPNGENIEPEPAANSGCPGSGPSDPGAHAATQRKLQAITAGRLWDEGKGLDLLRDLRSPIPLLVAGENTLSTAQAEAGWPDHLTNLGPLSRTELHQQFRQSAIYLCTSRYEPFGLAPLEAALCGCALVLRDLPSLREIWADNALYFTDSASLTSTLNVLATDPDLLSEAQRRSHQRALQYTPERMADSYLHLFQSVLQQQQATQHVA